MCLAERYISVFLCAVRTGRGARNVGRKFPSYITSKTECNLTETTANSAGSVRYTLHGEKQIK